MPELPDVELYRTLLERRLVGREFRKLELFTPFVLRSVNPSPLEFVGRRGESVRRIGKRIVLAFSGELYAVVHLMIAGRFRWVEGVGEARLGGKIAVAAFRFENGTLFLTEAGSKKRASITLMEGQAQLAALDPGGVDVLLCSEEEFSRVLRSESHTVKDALTTPQLFSGIGNAYSDEILHAARLSPLKRTQALTSEEVERLYRACVDVLNLWVERLHAQFDDRFPGAGDVTAFRPEFAVHGKFGEPCPICGKPVQRIRYAENEANYCAQCQNDGRILADRALSRLLKDDFPRSL